MIGTPAGSELDVGTGCPALSASSAVRSDVPDANAASSDEETCSDKSPPA